jgi:hypothetical protein
MMRAALLAAIPLMLSCAGASGPRDQGVVLSEGDDPSRDRYLTETFLDEVSSGFALEAGVGSELDLSGGRERRDAWVRIGARGISGAGRVRSTGDSFREAFHLAVVPTGRLRIDLGDFVPDLGIGLISSGRRFAYPFSSRHPLYRPKGIKGWTGFYGSFIRGGAIHAAAGPVRVTLLSGRPASHGSSGVEYSSGGDISGIRFEAGGDAIIGGLTAMDSGSREGERIAGLDFTFSSSGRRYMLETATSSSGNISAAWGMTIDGKDIDCGIIGWSVPAGSDGFLASLPGLSEASGRSRSGASIVLKGKLPRRMHISTWGEVRRSSDGRDRELDRALRFEAGIRWKRSAARCAWSSRVKESEDLVPFPPGQELGRDITSGLALSFSCRPTASLALVIELKRPGGESCEGLMCASRASLAFRSLHSRLSISVAAYSSRSGNPRFSLYEPSGGGKYPWKTLYGSGKRIALGLDTEISVIRTSLFFLWTPEGAAEAALRLSAAI